MIVLYGIVGLWVASAALCVIGLCLAAQNPMPEAVETRNNISISREQREFESQTIVNHPVCDPALANVNGSS